MAEETTSCADRKWMYEVAGMHEYKPGFLCLPECPPRVMTWMEETLQFQKGDVMIANYPGAGIVWLQEVLWLINKPAQLEISRPSRESIGKRVVFIEHQWFDMDPEEILKDYPSPRLYKTHVPAEHIDHHFRKNNVKVIVWMTDPRACLARYHFLYNTGGIENQGFTPITWNDFFELHKEKQLFEGDWFDTYKSYMKYKDDPNFLFLRSENVVDDLMGTIEKIAKFTDRNLTRDMMERIASDGPFDRVPDWKKKFTPEQLEYFENEYKTHTTGTALEHLYM